MCEQPDWRAQLSRTYCGVEALNEVTQQWLDHLRKHLAPCACSACQMLPVLSQAASYGPDMTLYCKHVPSGAHALLLCYTSDHIQAHCCSCL